MLPLPILLGLGLVGAYLLLSPAAPWASPVQTPPSPSPSPAPLGGSSPPSPSPTPIATTPDPNAVPPFVPGFNDQAASGILNPQPGPTPVGGGVPMPVAPSFAASIQPVDLTANPPYSPTPFHTFHTSHPARLAHPARQLGLATGRVGQSSDLHHRRWGAR